MRPLDLEAVWPIVTQLAAPLEVRRPAAPVMEAAALVAEVAMAVKAVEAAALVNSVAVDAAAMAEVEAAAAVAEPNWEHHFFDAD